MDVPFQVPDVIVPTVAISVPTSLDEAINPANIPLVTLRFPMDVANDPVPDPVTSPVKVIVWSPVLVPETEASKGTVKVLEVVPPAMVNPLVWVVKVSPLYVFPVRAVAILPSAIVVPFQVPVVMVPTVAMSVPTSLDAAMLPANIPLVTVPVSPVVTTVPVTSGKVQVLLADTKSALVIVPV